MALMNASFVTLRYQIKKLKRYGLLYPSYIAAVPVRVRIDQ